MYLPHSWMYWTDTYSPASIKRASMDGSNQETLHDTDLSTPYDITIDYDTQTLYWLDYSRYRLESSNVDGTNRLVLTTYSSIYRPYALTFYKGKVYWTEFNYNRILTTTVSSPSNLTVIVSSTGYDSYGIQAIAEDRQPHGECLFLTNKCFCTINIWAWSFTKPVIEFGNAII